MTPIERQLNDELRVAVEQLGNVIPSLHPGLQVQVARQIAAAARNLALSLTSDDDHERADTAIDIMCALWPGSEPLPQWWTTPVGLQIAMSAGFLDAQAWTHSVAAAHLGVTRGTVSQLAKRGTIAAHPDGGLVAADVVRYGQQRRPR